MISKIVRIAPPSQIMRIAPSLVPGFDSGSPNVVALEAVNSPSLRARLFQGNAEDVDRAAQGEYCEDSCSHDSPKETFAWGRIQVHHFCGSEVLYPFFFISVPVECGLKCRLQCALIAFGQRKESERLLGAGERKKHFCCAQHGSLVSLKHQLDNGALIQRPRQ